MPSLLDIPDDLLYPPPIAHLRFGRKEIRDEILTMTILNTETREGLNFRMTVTDCYVTRWVRRPIFGGPGRSIRVLDDVKLTEKLKQYVEIELRNLGWIRAGG